MVVRVLDARFFDERAEFTVDDGTGSIPCIMW
jgi:hypothetical protein